MVAIYFRTFTDVMFSGARRDAFPHTFAMLSYARMTPTPETRDQLKELSKYCHFGGCFNIDQNLYTLWDKEFYFNTQVYILAFHSQTILHYQNPYLCLQRGMG